MNHRDFGLDMVIYVSYFFTIQAVGKVFKKILKLHEVLVLFASYLNSLVGLEARGSSHLWARELSTLGYDIKLLNARHVKTYVRGNKNNFNDTEAIFDAVSRPNVRMSAIKTVGKQDIALIHPLR